MVAVVSDEGLRAIGVQESELCPPGYLMEELLVRFGIVEVTIHSIRKWKQLIKDITVRLMICQLQPRQVKLKEALSVKWKLNLFKLKFNVYGYLDRHLVRSQDEFKKNNLRNTKKALVNCFRIVSCAIQIASGAQVLDYTETNRFFAEISELDVEGYVDLMEWFHGRFNGMLEGFKGMVNVYKQFAVERAPSASHPVLQYISSHSLQETLLHFALKATQHPRVPELLQLYSDFYSPPNSEISLSCSGLVVHLKDMKVVCAPIGLFFPLDADETAKEPFVPEICWEAIKISKKVNGIEVTLYHYEGQWLLTGYCYTLYAHQYCKRNGMKASKITEKIEEVFWELWRDLGYKLPDPAELFNYTFSIHPEERILVLIGVRSLCNFQEVEVDTFIERFGWKPAEPFPFTLQQKGKDGPIKARYSSQLVSLLDKECLSICQYQGLMITDSKFNRVIIESKPYNLLDNMNISDGSTKIHKFFTIIRTNYHEKDKFISYFTDWKDWFLHTLDLFDKLCNKINTIYSSISQLSSDTAHKRTLINQSPEDKKIKGILLGMAFSNLSHSQAYFTDPLHLYSTNRRFPSSLLIQLHKDNQLT
eukprot:TRINITY_DN8954_c0_g1_i1.p1 TRINITY_DN8954_c0_g1~~TRINITY_DN8954_c0_g1_i1.p1  ORF type:complete len:655 (-),score=156.44 TRINITY_DN8954_c0_g1_i1:19-1791(-)